MVERSCQTATGKQGLRMQQKTSRLRTEGWCIYHAGYIQWGKKVLNASTFFSVNVSNGAIDMKLNVGSAWVITNIC